MLRDVQAAWRVQHGRCGRAPVRARQHAAHRVLALRCRALGEAFALRGTHGTRLRAKEAAKDEQLQALIGRGFEAQEAAQYRDGTSSVDDLAELIISDAASMADEDGAGSGVPLDCRQPRLERGRA